MQHAPNFLRLVDEARTRVTEITIDQARARLHENPKCAVVDVREDHEWAAGRAQGATHLGKGIIERDLEGAFPDFDAELIMYCGGGFRSILTCDAAQKMGYRRVYSLVGGFKGLVAAGWPIVK
ncbi:MAG: rhodanese-like domain-containing protein [Limisphaerales bacterium]